MMAAGAWEHMPENRQLFRRSMAEAVASLLSRKYPSAKHIARGVGIDTATAENVKKGNLSVTTLASILLAEGRGFYQALGDEIYGQPFLDYEEARLNTLIKEAESARENIHRMAARRQTLEARTARALADLDGSADQLGGGAEVSSGAPTVERGPKPPRSRKA